jgi:drug/metabolite transporter (DMT)-like permease
VHQWRTRTTLRHTPRQLWILLAAGVALALHFATWIASLDYTSIAISTLLVAASPLWTAIYDILVRKQRYPTSAGVAFLAAIGGVALVSTGHSNPAPYPGHEFLGAGLALAGSAGFAVYLLLVREIRSELDTLAIVSRTYSIAGIVLVGAMLVGHQHWPALDDRVAWGGILAMALISQLLGHTGMNAALRWFSPSIVALSTLLEPVVAALLALVVFGEQLAPAAVLGALLILAALGTIIWLAPDGELA